MSLAALSYPLNLSPVNFPLEASNTSLGTIDAAGESVGVIGRVYIPGGGAKTVSAAGGGAIWWCPVGITWANGASNLRVGVQDVASTGLEDGTHDVYADITGGAGISANTSVKTAMTSGSKTIAHRDEVAVVFELTARGGSDSVQVRRLAFRLPNVHVGFVSGFFTPQKPYGTFDTGGGVAKTAQCPIAFIEFDDGTLGWIEHAAPPVMPLDGSGLTNWYPSSVTAYSSSSNPDEWAAIFEVPFACEIQAIGAYVGSLAAADDTFELILYSDPLGTPTVIEAVAVDPDYTAYNGQLGRVMEPITPVILTPGTLYAVAVRATGAGTITMGYWTNPAGFGDTKQAQVFGSSAEFGSRQNQSGAFSVANSEYLPDFIISISKLDDGRGIAEASAALGVM